jgi:curved DNA-binding protein CbpA
MEYESSQSKPVKRKMEREHEITKHGKLEETYAKRKKGCNVNEDHHLGFCNLYEISYYDCLKLTFKPEKPESPISEVFVKLVNIAVNRIILEVRHFDLNEELRYNKVTDIVALIEESRLILTNPKKKRIYDQFLKFKLTHELAIIDSHFDGFTQLVAVFKSRKDEIQKLLQTFFTTIPSAFDLSQIDDPEIILLRNITERSKQLLKGNIKRNAKKREIKHRSTILNRIQIDWKLFASEVDLSREEIANVIKTDFEKYGEIKFIFICPVEKNKVVVEYTSSDSVQKAIKGNASQQNRYTVTEFLVTRYYSTTLLKTMNNKVKELSKKLQNINKSLLSSLN